MPNAGQTTDAATIGKIMVKKGDTIKRGDILLEAETDKAVLPIESFAEGTVIEVCVKEGDSVESGSILVLIGDEEDKTSSIVKEQTVSLVPFSAKEENTDDEYVSINKKEIKKTESLSCSSFSQIKNMTVKGMLNAKKFAKEHNIDISQISPANGIFIKLSDVKNFVSVKSANNNEYTIMPLTQMRKIIAKRMIESVKNIPSFQVTVKINMANAIALKTKITDKTKYKISYNDIIMKCISKAAEKYLLLNARFENGEIRIYRNTNIGLAVSLDEGLVVPVVKAVNEKGILEIAASNKKNIENAKNGKLKLEDMGCGSITVSNLGMFDVDQFTAIVNPPENSIFALGSIVKEPIWNGNNFEAENIMKITASFDHRIIDGAYGAVALKEIKTIIESPELILC